MTTAPKKQTNLILDSKKSNPLFIAIAMIGTAAKQLSEIGSSKIEKQAKKVMFWSDTAIAPLEKYISEATARKLPKYGKEFVSQCAKLEILKKTQNDLLYLATVRLYVGWYIANFYIYKFGIQRKKEWKNLEQTAWTLILLTEHIFSGSEEKMTKVADAMVSSVAA